MRILLISPFVPFPPRDGGSIRVYELLKGLAHHHDVELLALVEPTPEGIEGMTELRRSGFRVDAIHHTVHRRRAMVRGLLTGASLNGTLVRSSAFARRLTERLSVDRFDSVQCEYATMAPYRPHRNGPPWVLDAYDVEFAINASLAAAATGARQAPYRSYARREARVRRREEVGSWRRMDHVITVSELDRAVVRELAPGTDTTVVPNGVDVERARPPDRWPRAVGRSGAVFVGKMDYRPNVDAVGWFANEVLPIIQAKVAGFGFTIVGGRPTPPVLALGRRPEVRVTGVVADPLPFLHRAAVAVVPLRARSGSRLKILEALAAGTPVVSTPAGAEGLDVADGRHLLLAEGRAAFAAAVVRLLADGSLGARLAQAGRHLVEERYGWSQAVDRLLPVHELLAGDRGGRDG